MPTLNWIGKEAVVKHHLDVPFHLLKDVPELSCGDPGSGNLIVQGDNLVALKALLPHYAGQVKCICIDPPYNTGNEGWAYNDNVNSPVIREWLGKVVGKEGETLDRHDRWLCMMYPRLALLKKFLREDGVIFVNIDENETAYLIHLMDDIFGRNNRLGEIIWDKGNPKGDSIKVAYQHESIICYARSLAKLKEQKTWFSLPKPNADAIIRKAALLFKRIGKADLPDDLKKIVKKYNFPVKQFDSFRKTYSSVDAQEELRVWNQENKLLKGGEKPYFRIDTLGKVYRLTSMAWPNKKKAPDDYFEPILEKKTGRRFTAPKKGWRFPPATIDGLLNQNLIEFSQDPDVQPQKILYLEENMRESISSIMRYGGSDDDLFSDFKILFEHPKPYKFISSLIEAFSDNDSIILDSFGGSGTTAHAVINQNAADGGTRRFITIEMSPSVVKNITAKRVTQVIAGYTNAKGEKVAGLGGGFRFCELGEPLFDENGHIRETVKFGELARHVYFSETREPLPRERVPNTPLLGVCRGIAVYLLFNGILGDKSSNGGNVLTRKTLAKLPPFAGPKVIYCAGCLIGAERLAEEGITVRQTPYEIRVS